MALEFRDVGLLEQRPPAREVRLAHREGLIRGGRLAMGDSSTLGLMVHRHIHKLTGRACRHHQPADRGSLVTRPASEVQDHVGSQPERLQTKPEQPAFQHIALPLRLRITEQREHPLIRRQPQSAVLLGQLPSSRGLSGPGQTNRQEQRRHTQILSRRPSGDDCSWCRDRQAPTRPGSAIPLVSSDRFKRVRRPGLPPCRCRGSSRRRPRQGRPFPRVERGPGCHVDRSRST